jgi:phosphatidylglycerophosphatase A
MNQVPSPGFLVRHPAHFIALGFGAGLAPVAPGTFGTLVAFPLAAWALPIFGNLGYVLLCVALFALGCWASGVTGKALGQPDHGAIVWDEVVAFMLVLWVIPAGDAWAIAAFLLFRFFDIVKPPPARVIDLHWKTGFGVMADDLVAAFYTALALALWQRFFG